MSDDDEVYMACAECYRIAGVIMRPNLTIVYHADGSITQTWDCDVHGQIGTFYQSAEGKLDLGLGT